MKKVVDNVVRIVQAISVAIMSVMVIVVFLATVGRYTHLFSIPWSEECSRYCMIAIVYLGLMLASVSDGHFIVEIIPMIFRKRPGVIKAVSVVVTVLVDIFAVFLAYYGWTVCAKMLTLGKQSPMLRLPLGCVYLLIPVGVALMAVFYTIRSVQKLTNKELTDQEEGKEEIE
ncbi:MAG: TRAP transporter small permease [Lachnospiraceae bacterium]|nr:TRAP transporter small permease [Lachnospiraceae bacterium]MDD3794458.1 TRAP transporter small permease [Lachnospiraceae bacterium]